MGHKEITDILAKYGTLKTTNRGAFQITVVLDDAGSIICRGIDYMDAVARVYDRLYEQMWGRVHGEWV